MNLRDALIHQAPSLELLRSAQAEIARLDNEIRNLTQRHYEAQVTLAQVMVLTKNAEHYNDRIDEKELCPTGDDYCELLDFIFEIQSTVLKVTR